MARKKRENFLFFSPTDLLPAHGPRDDFRQLDLSANERWCTPSLTVYLGAELLDTDEHVGVGEHMASTLLLPSGRFNVHCADQCWISRKKTDKEQEDDEEEQSRCLVIKLPPFLWKFYWWFREIPVITGVDCHDEKKKKARWETVREKARYEHNERN